MKRYEKPEIRTLTARELLELIGPAQGMSSEVGGAGLSPGTRSGTMVDNALLKS